MVAVDTLVHNFLHRTGALQRLRARHPYGPGCYAPGGCAEVLDELAQRIDARELNPAFPAYFPRLLQNAIWRFCAANEHNICNGNQVNDRHRCKNVYCPAFDDCGRIALKG